MLQIKSARNVFVRYGAIPNRLIADYYTFANVAMRLNFCRYETELKPPANNELSEETSRSKQRTLVAGGEFIYLLGGHRSLVRNPRPPPSASPSRRALW